jgi:23S rRNA pseudouridine1911/1915/1917 synthase
MTKAKATSFTIAPDATKQRLDIFLVAELGVSRSQVQKMIDEEKVFINGKLPRKAGDTLMPKAVVTITAGTVAAALPVAPKRSAKKTTIDLEIEILAETPDYIVINKPTGLLTHTTMANEKSSVATILSKKYPEIKKVGDDPMRPGIVHRLDKDASGLLVVARTQAMFDASGTPDASALIKS